MPIFIIDKLKPKNGGTFKLMDTLDINHKGYELEDFLDSLENKLNDLVETLPDKVKTIEIQNFDGVLKWRYTSDSEWTELIDLTGATTKKEVYVGDQEPTDENVQIWVDTSQKDPSEDSNVINIPTKMSDLENDKDYVSIQDLKDNLSLGLSDDGDNIVLKYKDETLLTISITETKTSTGG